MQLKLTQFNRTIFFVTFLVTQLLLIPSFIGAFSLDEGTLDPGDTVFHFFAGLFEVLRFPTHTIFGSLIFFAGPYSFYGGLLLNGLFYGLVVERFTFLLRKKNEKNE